MLMIEGWFKNNLIDSSWNYFDEYGRIITQGKFNNGTGILVSWFPNGKLMRKTMYKSNEKDGKELIYNYKGEIEKIKIYKNGKFIAEK